MKVFGTAVAAAGVVLLMAIGGAAAQGNVTTGTGAAKTENAPSAVGLASTERSGAMRPRMGKRKMMKRKRMKRRM